MLKLSNKFKLTYNIIALLILGLLSSTTVSYLHVKRNLHDAVHNELTLKASAVSIKLSSWLESNLALVTSFAQTLANSDVPIRDNRKYEFYLNQVSKSRQLDFLSFALEEDGYFMVNDWEVPLDHDPRTQPWYLASKNTMAPRVTSSYVDGEVHVYVEASAPIIRNDAFLGVVLGEVTFNNVQKIILDMDMGYDGFAFLIKKSGGILIHSSENKIGTSIFDLEDLDGQDDFNVMDDRIVGGKEFLYSFTPINNTHWRLVVAANKSQFNKVLTTETFSLLIHFLAIFVVIMAAFFLSNRRIFSPLIDLLERDSVTNLPNKKNFKQQVNDRFLAKSLSGLLVIISVDNFNKLTAAYSHEELILLFNQIKDRMRSMLIQSSLLGHFSESRFITYINWDKGFNDRAQLAWLQSVAEKLSSSYLIQGRKIHCTFSIGACCFPDHGADIENLIDNSFSVIADGKRSGISSCGIFVPIMNQQLGNELLIISAMKSAIGNNEFYMQYQPQYDYQKQQLIGMEALIRWNSKELGRTVSPGEFIPIAEDSVLIVLLGDFVIDTVIKQIKNWNDEGFVFGRVSINISPKQLLIPEFTEKLLTKLSRNGISSSQLELEITETSVLNNPEDGIKILEQLSRAGFYITIDDFGTGYSSLEYLKLMPVNKLKIDRAFVRDLTIDSKDSAILKIIVDLASALDFQLLAEGVETKEQLDILIKSGCYSIQGYYYSKPVDVSVMEVKLRENSLLAFTSSELKASIA